MRNIRRGEETINKLDLSDWTTRCIGLGQAPCNLPPEHGQLSTQVGQVLVKLKKLKYRISRKMGLSKFMPSEYAFKYSMPVWKLFLTHTHILPLSHQRYIHCIMDVNSISGGPNPRSQIYDHSTKVHRGYMILKSKKVEEDTQWLSNVGDLVKFRLSHKPFVGWR